MRNIDFSILPLCVLMLCACDSNDRQANEVQIPLLTDSLRNVVTVEEVKEAPYADDLILNGQIQPDPNKIAHVFPMFGGEVIQMNATVGDYVRRGEVLAVVRSGEVADYHKQMNDADLQILAAQRDSAAMHDMYNGGMASSRDMLQADKSLKNAKSERQRLREIYSINHITGKSTYAITAPISGFVLASNASPNMQIRPDQDEELFTIADLDNVWVMADVYEKDISKVHQGSTVQVETLSYGSNYVITAKIDKVYPILDAESKTESVRINVNNPDYKLKPEMFTNVYVDVAPTGEYYPAVPTEAVIFDDNHDYVVTVDANNVLSLRRVKVVKESQRGISYIGAGLKAGERIIVHNALIIYNSLK